MTMPVLIGLNAAHLRAYDIFKCKRIIFEKMSSINLSLFNISEEK